MSIEKCGLPWQDRWESSAQKNSNSSISGYSPATLPPAVVPRRPPARIRLPVWLAFLISAAMLFLTVVAVGKVGQLIFDARSLSEHPIIVPHATSAEKQQAELAATATTLATVRQPAVRQPLAAASIPVVTAKPQQLAASWSAAITDWESEIVRAAEPYQFAPDLVAAVVNIESDGRPTGVSYAGAVGLMGVMPQGSGAGLDNRPTSLQLRNPVTNLKWGTQILAKYLHDADGDLLLALSAYNGGWGYANTTPTLTYGLDVLHQTGYALAARAGVEDAGVIWGIEWEVCPCDGSGISINETDILPTLLFDDGEMRIEGIPVVAVE